MDVQAIEAARQTAEEMYRTGQFLCSEAVFMVANDYLGHPVSDDMVRLASGFPVGMGFAGCVCGALSGGVMALGLKYGRSQPGVETPGMFETTKELHNRFRSTPPHYVLPRVDAEIPTWLSRSHGPVHHHYRRSRRRCGRIVAA